MHKIHHSNYWESALNKALAALERQDSPDNKFLPVYFSKAGYP